MKSIVSACACIFLACAGVAVAQTVSATQPASDAELRYVVYLERHGVRSPTGKPAQYGQYSVASWPEWTVPPGYLTPHGFHLIELFGAYDRLLLAREGVLSATGCSETSRVTIYADSDQRTQQTGVALAKGLMPGCNLAVQSLPEGTNDPLFHVLGDTSVPRDTNRARAAVAGRIGGDPANLTQAYQPQLQMLDHVLATCGKTEAPPTSKRTSLFDIPATLSTGSGDHLVELKGPVNTASTLAENLLLEYTEGMNPAQVGWGCVGHAELEALMNLHTAATDFTQRTPEIAKIQAGTLLRRIGLSIEQAVSGNAIPGAAGKPTDRVLYLVGHDTNQENVAGALNLTWILDGRLNDTPPGGALVFEVWQAHASGRYSVRTYFTAQTLTQMRESRPLSLAQPPERAPVFIPGCSGQDLSCDLSAFLNLVTH
jgi:4-phytase/acid phosphatase